MTISGQITLNLLNNYFFILVCVNNNIRGATVRNPNNIQQIMSKQLSSCAHSITKCQHANKIANNMHVFNLLLRYRENRNMYLSYTNFRAPFGQKLNS